MRFVKVFMNSQLARVWLLLVVSLAAILIGMIMHNHSAKPTQVKSNSQPSTSSAPASKKPSPKEIQSYTVAADSPRYIYIPIIKIRQTRIKHLGVSKDGQIAVPDNINDTGWYNASAKPGQAGAMFIYGHVSSWEANGIFHDLNKLKPGNEVVVERGDGKKYIYKVVKTKIYQADSVDMNEVLSPINSKNPGLNLMTCTGKVKKGTSDFTERLVVFTDLQT